MKNAHIEKNKKETGGKYSKGLKNIENMITAVLFAAVFCVFLLASLILPDREFSENENRYLAKMPTLKAAAVADGSFSADFELYAQDSLAGRDALMMLKTAGDRALGRKDNGSVYFGKNGYLFAIEKVDSVQLEKNIGYMEKFCAAAEENDINVNVIVTPTATEILADRLPQNAPVPDQSEAIGKIKERLGDHFIDVTDNLRAHSDEYIFYKTDHHWTTLGAYYAYRQYADYCDISDQKTGVSANGGSILRSDAFDYELPADAGYTETIVSASFLGTNYSKAPGINIKPDTITRMEKSVADSSANAENGAGNGNIRMSILSANLECEKIFDSVYDESYLDKKDKYSYFLSGNNPVTFIETERDASENGGVNMQAAEDSNAYGKGGRRNLLVVKDSYAHAFIPFLTSDFDTITAVDMRYYRSSLSGIIAEYEITDILVLYNVLNFASDSNLIYLAR